MKCSLGISNFLEKISSLSHSVVSLYFFALITGEGFFKSLLAILWNSAFRCEYLSFSPLLFASLLFSQLPYNPEIPLLGIHTEETRIERDMCIPVFIVALFTIARTGKQPRCPLADEWIRKLWYICTIKSYSDIKKNAFESVLMRWIQLEPIIQSEVSQKEKHHQNSILMHIYGI